MVLAALSCITVLCYLVVQSLWRLRAATVVVQGIVVAVCRVIKRHAFGAEVSNPTILNFVVTTIISDHTHTPSTETFHLSRQNGFFAFLNADCTTLSMN
jgi:hypothetical protein